MKKVFCIRDFAKSADVAKMKPLVIAIKKDGELNLVNLECTPSDRMKANIDPKTNEIVLRFKVYDNEFLALGEDEGVALTKTVKKGQPPQ